MAGLEEYKEKEVRVHEDIKISFRDLPNEIIMKTIEQLDREDRGKFGLVSRRMNELERSTGRRNLKIIRFTFVDHPKLEVVWDSKRNVFVENSPHEDIINFFRNATTKDLNIKGLMHCGINLSSVFKTLNFKNLTATISGAYSGRLISEVVQRQRCIKSVEISLDIYNDYKNAAIRILLSLPPMVNCTIKSMTNKPIINDEVFLHLVSVSKNTIIDCPDTNISARGLARAFEMVFSSQERKRVECYIEHSTLNQFKAQLDGRFTVNHRKIRHTASGSYVIESTSNGQKIHVAISSGLFHGKNL